jgi:hypothetical protein
MSVCDKLVAFMECVRGAFRRLRCEHKEEDVLVCGALTLGRTAVLCYRCKACGRVRQADWSGK